MFIFTIIIFIGSLGWAYFEPGWEPILFSIASLATMLSSNSSVIGYIKNKLEHFRAKKITIESGLISDSDEHILKIIKALCLGEDCLIKCIDVDALKLKKDSMKHTISDEERFYKKSKSDNFLVKSKLVESAFFILSELQKSHLVNVEISNLPKVLRNIVKITYPKTNGRPSYFIEGKTALFDIYSEQIEGQILSFVADFPPEVVEKILTKLNIESTNELAIPYDYSVLQLPEEAFNEYVLPAQIHAVLKKYPKYRDNENFWIPSNWAFGLH